MVLLHGYQDFGHTWQQTVNSGLLGQFDLVAPDARGHGDSDHVGPGGYYHFMDYAADLRSIISQLEFSRLSLVGHSMGGSVAAYYTGSHPEQVHKLALIEGLGPPTDERAPVDRVRNWVGDAAKRRTQPANRYETLDALTARVARDDPRLPEGSARYYAEHSSRELAGGVRELKYDPLLRAMGPRPFQLDYAGEFWDRIACPVLYVHGRDSWYNGISDLEERLLRFRDLRRVTLNNTGHMIQRDVPDQLGTVLTSFLAD